MWQVALPLMAAGTAANIYGVHKSQSATKNALKAYQGAVNEKVAQDRAALDHLMNLQGAAVAERQGDIGGYLSGLSQAWKTTPDTEQRALAGVASPNQEASVWYSGAPATQWQQAQQAQTGSAASLLARQLLEQHRQQAIQEQEQYAGYRLNLSDLMRRAKYLPIERRFQLAQALRDLDWQKKQAALQANLNRAQQAGQWYQLLGGLGTQAGGLLLAYGAGQPGRSSDTKLMNMEKPAPVNTVPDRTTVP